MAEILKDDSCKSKMLENKEVSNKHIELENKQGCLISNISVLHGDIMESLQSYASKAKEEVKAKQLQYELLRTGTISDDNLNSLPKKVSKLIIQKLEKIKTKKAELLENFKEYYNIGTGPRLDLFNFIDNLTLSNSTFTYGIIPSEEKSLLEHYLGSKACLNEKVIKKMGTFYKEVLEDLNKADKIKLEELSKKITEEKKKSMNTENSLEESLNQNGDTLSYIAQETQIETSILKIQKSYGYIINSLISYAEKDKAKISKADELFHELFNIGTISNDKLSFLPQETKGIVIEAIKKIKSEEIKLFDNWKLHYNTVEGPRLDLLNFINNLIKKPNGEKNNFTPIITAREKDTLLMYLLGKQEDKKELKTSYEETLRKLNEGDKNKLKEFYNTFKK